MVFYLFIFFFPPFPQVKLEKVDPYYMVQPDSLVDVSKDSRLSMTQDEADSWARKLREWGGGGHGGRVCGRGWGDNLCFFFVIFFPPLKGYWQGENKKYVEK